MEERGAKGSSVVRVQLLKLLREAGREDRVVVAVVEVDGCVVAVVGSSGDSLTAKISHSLSSLSF